ncbi:SpoIIE family protein phosphatase [Streptomyces sp. JJ36]|uniref:ATP-binding SpoIIE family protein phosphatase n=1 Tax=Streptomyces sp. JJ36 TaxID=2736645 RepID=UPI001F020325|nr:SpoIIE family protein phosphatase [Streptomyces sp. JJ36]MCF6525426.1 SpoIIE family protein phosphatase [Streptomyces sp. JJ36]
MQERDAQQPPAPAGGHRFTTPGDTADAGDALLGGILRRATEELSASAAYAYVLGEGGRALHAAVVIGGPVSLFTLVRRIEIDDDRYTVGRAFRRNRQVTASYAQNRFDVPLPFPYTAASTPVRAAGMPVGVLTVIWAPPEGPRELGAPEQSCCVSVADTLAPVLQALPPPPSPRFLMPLRGGPDGGPPPRDRAGQDVPGVAEYPGIDFFYRIYTLASVLTETVRLDDILDAAVAYLMQPFAAQSLAVAVVDRGVPRVLGYSGYPTGLGRASSWAAGGTDGAGPRIPAVESALFLEDPAALRETETGSLAEGKQACALLPLVIGGRPDGVLALGFDRPRTFGPDERAALVVMSGLLGQTLGRARLFEAERSLARGLQRGLLPHSLPHLEQLETAVRYLPASPDREVGGDWYDVLTLPDGAVGLVVGDVEGHSPGGAAIMGQIRSGVRAYAAEGHPPDEVLRRTNRLLADLGIDLFVTCCCVWLDLDDGTARIACAGHPLPVLSHPARGVLVPDVPVGLPLGVAPDTGYQPVEVPVPAGTVLALYTDGLVHSRSVELAVGTGALHDALRAGNDGHRLEDLATRLAAIAGGPQAQEDDVALLLARYDGPARGAHRRIGRMAVHRHDLKAVRDVREFVRRHLRDWGWEKASAETELMATELVTNALVHADSDVEVRLRELPDLIRVEVRDSDPRPPLPAPILVAADADLESEAEHGRGLVIVDALASVWGNSPSGRGKAVWFEISRG